LVIGPSTELAIVVATILDPELDNAGNLGNDLHGYVVHRVAH
jgi:hypothetical protein